MLIIGAGACTRDLLAMLELDKQEGAVHLYDDLNLDAPDFLYGKYPILKSEEAAQSYFKNINNTYTIGVGKPHPRYRLAQKFDALGGKLISLISSQTQIGKYSTISKRGVIIMHGSIFTNEVNIGEGSLINMRCTLGHFCTIGRFCALAPGVLASSSTIGDFSRLGINVVIKPGINIGKNVTVGAGAIVVKHVPDNWIVAGNPAVKIGENKPLNF